MIQVTDEIALNEDELEFNFIRASGPGGQNVNKVSSAVQLRFDARRSASLPDDVATRLIRLAGARATKDGVIVISAMRFRSQEQNRSDSVARLVDLVRRAAERPKIRRPTRPSRAVRERRLDEKGKAAETKANRRPVRRDEG
jgi:ribosome-associated protein